MTPDGFVEVKWGIYFAKTPLTKDEILREDILNIITDMYSVEGLSRLAQCHPLFSDLDYPSMYSDDFVLFLKPDSLGGSKFTVFRFLHNLATPE